MASNTMNILRYFGEEIPGSKLDEARLAVAAGDLIFVDLQFGKYKPNLVREREAVMRLAQVFGKCAPHTSDPNSFLWDIKAARGQLDGNTFSKHNKEAWFHTDSQYCGDPEALVVLYCVHRAACGGGNTMAVDGCELEKMAAKEFSSKQLSALYDFAYPFPVPDEFVATFGELYNAPIFASRPLVRFRYDTIQKELSRRMGTEIDDARSALDQLNNLVGKLDRTDLELQRGQAIIMNNHKVLHARTEFSDLRRHLIRARIQEMR